MVRKSSSPNPPCPPAGPPMWSATGAQAGGPVGSAVVLSAPMERRRTAPPGNRPDPPDRDAPGEPERRRRADGPPRGNPRPMAPGRRPARGGDPPGPGPRPALSPGEAFWAFGQKKPPEAGEGPEAKGGVGPRGGCLRQDRATRFVGAGAFGAAAAEAAPRVIPQTRQRTHGRVGVPGGRDGRPGSRRAGGAASPGRRSGRGSGGVRPWCRRPGWG